MATLMRTKSWLLLPAAAMVILGVLVFRSQRPETFGSTAQRFLDCLETRDYGCLADFASQEEKEATGLTEERLGRLMASLDTPDLKGAKRVAAATFSPFDGENAMLVEQPYALASGKEAQLNLFLRRSEQGIELKDALATILLWASWAEPGEFGTGQGRAWKRYATQADRLAKLGPETGLTGLTLNSGGEHARFFGWSEWRDDSHRRATRVASGVAK